jgi:hypothetical protein
MTKQIVSIPVGHDGGKVGLDIDNGMVELKVSYPVAKIVEPLKTKVVDKLKSFIPGTWDDALIDKAWAELIAELSDAPAPVAAVQA